MFSVNGNRLGPNPFGEAYGEIQRKAHGEHLIAERDALVAVLHRRAVRQQNRIWQSSFGDMEPHDEAELTQPVAKPSIGPRGGNSSVLTIMEYGDYADLELVGVWEGDVYGGFAHAAINLIRVV